MEKYLNKKYLLGAAIALAALLFFSCNDVEAQEFNYGVDKDDLTTQLRVAEDSYWHAQFGMDVLPRLQVAYRYAELDGFVENRVQFTYDLLSFAGVSLMPRMEYRMFDDRDDDDGSDMWRVRMIALYDRPVLDNVNLWVKLQPRWELADATLEADDWRNQVGLSFDRDGYSIAPFFELRPRKGLDSVKMFGTYFKVAL